MKLYGFPASPNTWKVRALAAHVGVPLELEVVDLTKGAQKSPAYLALNPTGRTPTLIDGDFTLWESTAILQYIAASKRSPLYPDDARSRADIARWQSWQLQHWGGQACEPLLMERVVKPLFGLGAPDAAAVARAEQAFHTEAKVLDAYLAKRDYLVSDALTIAEFSVGAPLLLAELGKYPLAPYANIERWFGKVAALPCWKETAPPPM